MYIWESFFDSKKWIFIIISKIIDQFSFDYYGIFNILDGKLHMFSEIPSIVYAAISQNYTIELTSNSNLRGLEFPLNYRIYFILFGYWK